MSSALRKALERLRDGFADEVAWHRFLLDAYTGGGGFRGRIKACVSELGSAAACYVDGTVDSYLDRYDNEDDDKFKARKQVAYYLNYVEALTDLKLSFMLAKPFTTEGLPKQIEDWRRDVDGQGTTMDHMRLRVARRAAIFGWAPTVVDMLPVPEGVTTMAQAREVGAGMPRITPMFPANLTEWRVEGAKFAWAKVKTAHADRPDPLGDERKYTRYDLWFPDRVDTYEIEDKANGEPVLVASTFHSFQRVPITVCRHKEAEDDPIVGLPMHGAVSLVARRIFNLCSEGDENLRLAAFPLLVLAESIEQGADEDQGDDERTVGTRNALILDKSAGQKHYYMGPPADIMASIEKRIDALIRESYRMARTEHVRPAGVADATGIARRYAFAATNAAIAAFATNVALWEQETYINVGRALNVSENELEKIRTIAPSEFDIEDLDAAIKHAVDALTASLGPTAGKAIKSRLVSQLLPNVDDETRAQIEQELEEAAVEEESDEVFGKSGSQPPKPGEKVPPEEDEPDDEEDDANE